MAKEEGAGKGMDPTTKEIKEAKAVASRNQVPGTRSSESAIPSITIGKDAHERTALSLMFAADVVANTRPISVRTKVLQRRRVPGQIPQSRK